MEFALGQIEHLRRVAPNVKQWDNLIMLPFPRIVLELRCPPGSHEDFMALDSGIPRGMWIGPRDVVCPKRGKSGKKYLFDNSMAKASCTTDAGSLLQAALTSLEPARIGILPNTVGCPEYAFISIILPPERICVWFDSHVLAQLSSFALSLNIDHRFALPLTAKEKEEDRALVEINGMEIPHEIHFEDW